MHDTTVKKKSMNVYLKDHAEKLYIMLQRSATISRCREHIWHGCTMLFVKILAFDQNVWNANRCTTVPTRRRLLSMWLMSTSRECKVRNRVTFISFLVMRLECTWRGQFHSLQFVAPRMRSMHLRQKTETRWTRASSPTTRSGDSSPRTTAFLVTALTALMRWNTLCRISITRRNACIHGDYKALRNP
jgi:hypothetical protein